MHPSRLVVMSQPAPIEDFLDADSEISGQRYVLLSFLSPEKVLDKKELFFFQKFLHVFEVEWKVKNLEKYMVDIVKHINDALDANIKELEKKEQNAAAEICRTNRLRVDEVMTQYSAFIQKNKGDLNKTKLAEAYDDFLYTHKTKLEEEFHALNDFHPTIRGIKVRGVYGNQKEAELRAKKLQTQDKYHSIFMGEVGKWTPWDPAAHEVKEQEYNNDQLNTLMKKYHENEDSREKFFEERTKEAKQSVPKAPKESLGQFDSMFSGQGDVAHRRQVESGTEEKEVENTIVTPDA